MPKKWKKNTIKTFTFETEALPHRTCCRRPGANCHGHQVLLQKTRGRVSSHPGTPLRMQVKDYSIW